MWADQATKTDNSSIGSTVNKKNTNPVLLVTSRQLNHFHNLTNLSWLAEATKPVTVDTANAAISPSWADRVIVLFSVMFQSSRDCTQQVKKWNPISNVSSHSQPSSESGKIGNKPGSEPHFQPHYNNHKPKIKKFNQILPSNAIEKNTHTKSIRQFA